MRWDNSMYWLTALEQNTGMGQRCWSMALEQTDAMGQQYVLVDGTGAEHWDGAAVLVDGIGADRCDVNTGRIIGSVSASGDSTVSVGAGSRHPDFSRRHITAAAIASAVAADVEAAAVDSAAVVTLASLRGSFPV